jgi:hypothetical protein
MSRILLANRIAPAQVTYGWLFWGGANLYKSVVIKVRVFVEVIVHQVDRL